MQGRVCVEEVGSAAGLVGEEVVGPEVGGVVIGPDAGVRG
jgi:hypothetical protein